MSELSRTSGVAIPTIKYYLREGLLPSGESTSANQARYSAHHVARLRLIRALIDVGGLSVASARGVLEAVDSPDLPLGHLFGAAQLAVSQTELYSTPTPGGGRDRIDAVIADRGWNVSNDNPGRTGAANVINTFTSIGHADLVELIDDYADAAEVVARADLSSVTRQPDVAAMAETVVAGTVLGDAMFAALRRIAQEHFTHELFPGNDAVDRVGGRSPALSTPT